MPHAIQEEWDEDEKMMMKFLKELYTASNYPKRNWKGICIALLIISVVCTLVTLAVIIMSIYDGGIHFRGAKLTIDDILSEKLKPQHFLGGWISDNELLYRARDGHVILYNVKNDSSKVFMTNNAFRRLNSDTYYVSPDRRFVLIEYNSKKVKRVPCSQYSIFDTLTEHQFDLLPGTNQNEVVHFQYAGWVGQSNALVMVYNNDIYLKHSVDDKDSLQLTHTGLEGVIYNGVPDPLYSGSIWKDRSAIWFSPDFQKVMFITFNTSLVEDLPLKRYLNVITATFYPEKLEDKIKFARPGKMITAASVTIMNLSDKSGMKVHKPVSVPDEFYITSAQWINDNLIGISYLERSQKRGVIALCSGSRWYCYQSYVEREDDGWVQFTDKPLFPKTGPNYLIVAPINDGNQEKYRQILMVNLKSHRSVPITMDTLRVEHICGWNEDAKHIYFTARPEENPESKHLYRVNYEVKEQLIWGIPHSSHCVTCTLEIQSESDNSSTGRCSFVAVKMSPTFEYYILQCLGGMMPRTYLFHIGSSVPASLLHNNDDLQERLAQFSMPSVKIFQVKLSSGYKASVKLFLPPGWLQTTTIKYPMLVQALGTFEMTSVTDKWSLGWAHYLSTREETIYVILDTRGADCCSESMKFELLNNLGNAEVEDHIEITQYLIENLKFVDPDSVAIWGWGYGGYVTIRALGHTNTPFKCGMPVSPITSWLFYDAVFSERYLGYPDKSDYFQNYINNDAMSVVKNLVNKSLFLVHGTADEVVPLHHTAFLMKSLTQEGIHFQSQMYPDSGHGLEDVQKHLYESLGNFLHTCYPHWMDNSSIELRELLYNEQERLSNYI